MALFRRRRNNDNDNGDESSNSEQNTKQKGGWRRPANTAFKQQRLKAWQPILTPKTVLPTLFIIGILFGPIGGLLIWGSSLVSEITLDYTECDTLAPSSSNTSVTFVNMPNYNYRLRSRDAHLPFKQPQWAFVNDSSASLGYQEQCIIQFDVPADLSATVLLYYKLTNFFQNHRRYVKSIDSDQLKGNNVSYSSVQGGDCKPLDVQGDKMIWPCGLIANSVFNDTFSNLTAVHTSGDGSTNSDYAFSEKGIAWPGEAKKYASAPGNDLTQIVPPPNWVKRFPEYNSSNLPNLHEDEHFQNWMRTAGLPTFTKLYGRNDDTTLVAGTYNITAFMNFPVKPYKGTKSIVISTVSWMGGKNPFLGWAYVVAAAIFVVLGSAGLIRHLVRPRRLGDMSLLSWSR